jgi:nitrogen fixation protein FixH
MPTIIEARPAAEPRRLTGRAVLIMLIAFFGVVIAVNMVMLKVAVKSFSGLEEKNAYLAGMSYDRALAAARAQDARGWKVEAHLERPAPGRTQVTLARSDDARASAQLLARARFEHPADNRQDRALALSPRGEGAWAGELDLPQGDWDLSIELRAGDEVVFRSRERVRIRD